MLSLLSAELLNQYGLTDSEDPMLTIRVVIEDDKAPQVFLTPTTGDNGLISLITSRCHESKAPKKSGTYIWSVRQYSEVEMIAEDKGAARLLFSLFRRDLAPAFEALEEMVKSLPTKAELQDAVDQGVNCMLRCMLNDGRVIDPRELRLSTVCSDCGPSELRLRELGLGGEILTLVEQVLAEVHEHRISNSIRARFQHLADAPPPKPNEFFLCSPLGHGHPFFALSVQLMDEAGNAMLRERAPLVATEFLQKARNFANDMDTMLS